MSEVWKEVNLRWKEMSEEEKRPYVERYETALESWRDERAKMKAQLEAMEEVDKSGDKENSHYDGWDLFRSDFQIPDATISNLGKVWNELSPEEKEVYNERARKINEKGQGDLLASTVKKFKSSRYGRPASAPTQFHNQFLSKRLKEAHEDIKREWSELSDEEREKYVKPYEVEYQIYKAEMEEYKAGDKYGENKRNGKVLRAKIKEIEEEMNKPRLTAPTSYSLFRKHNRDSFKGKAVHEANKAVSKMWQALTAEERIKYKAEWSKMKADFQTNVAEWEEKNAENPRMTELKAYKNMLETANKLGSF